jgi:hypothetical protein
VTLEKNCGCVVWRHFATDRRVAQPLVLISSPTTQHGGALFLLSLQGRVAMLPMVLFRTQAPFLPSLRDLVPFSLASYAALKRRSSTFTFLRFGAA